MYTTPPASLSEFLERLAGFFFSPFGVAIGLCLVASLVMLISMALSPNLQKTTRHRRKRR